MFDQKELRMVLASKKDFRRQDLQGLFIIVDRMPNGNFYLQKNWKGQRVRVIVPFVFPAGKRRMKSLLHSIYLWWHNICPLCEKGKKELSCYGGGVIREPYCNLCLEKKRAFIKTKDGEKKKLKKIRQFEEWKEGKQTLPKV